LTLRSVNVNDFVFEGMYFGERLLLAEAVVAFGIKIERATLLLVLVVDAPAVGPAVAVVPDPDPLLPEVPGARELPPPPPPHAAAITAKTVRASNHGSLI